jgi:hypothetical protein
MWRSGAPQRRVARAAPQRRQCTYVLLYEVRKVLTRVWYKESTHVFAVKELDGGRNLRFCAVAQDFYFRIVLHSINRTKDSLDLVVRSTSGEDVDAISVYCSSVCQIAVVKGIDDVWISRMGGTFLSVDDNVMFMNKAI